jgi:hypothetical protein
MAISKEIKDAANTLKRTDPENFEAVCNATSSFVELMNVWPYKTTKKPKGSGFVRFERGSSSADTKAKISSTLTKFVNAGYEFTFIG